MKKLKIILIAILCCSALLVGGGYSFNVLLNNSSVSAASDGYDFKNGPITSSQDPNYTENTKFYISNKKGLDNFAASVNNNEYVDFYGCTVTLTADIEYDREYDTNPQSTFKGIGVSPNYEDELIYEQQFFSGTFDGGGHTISKFLLIQPIFFFEFYNEWRGFYLEHFGESSCGFFAGLMYNATVKNLRIKDAIYKVQDWHVATHSMIYVGGIVGYVARDPFVNGESTNATITNCSVENLRLENAASAQDKEIGLLGNNGSDLSRYIGGIVGANYQVDNWGEVKGNLKIDNCYVSGFQSELHSKPYFITNGEYNDCVGAFIGHMAENSGTISNSVFNHTNSHRTSKSDKFYCANDVQYIGNESTVEDSVYCFNDTDNLAPDDEDFANLTTSSIGGPNGTAWYYSPEYAKERCAAFPHPMLRTFMSWQNVHAEAEGKGVSVSPASIQIPSNAYKTYADYHNFVSASTSISIYDQILSAEFDGGEGQYEFIGWYLEYNDNNERVYVATATLKKRTITFVNNDSTVDLNGAGTYEITSLETITIYYTVYSKQEAYEKIEFSFTNTNGDNCYVKYIITDPLYYISKSNIAEAGVKSYEVTSDLTISVETALKIYDSTFDYSAQPDS